MYLVDTGDDLLGDGHRVDMVGIQAITKPAHTRRNLTKSVSRTKRPQRVCQHDRWDGYLVKLHSLLPPISLSPSAPSTPGDNAP
jgi:hypothetical protein